MENKEMIVIEYSDGTKMEVELVTYLISENQTSTYVVYSKGEKNGPQEDHVIYISKVLQDGEVLKIVEITDDNEWAEVQKLLRKIANS